MLGAILNLIIVVIVAGFLFWALGKLWPFTKEFGNSFAGQVVYVLIVILLVGAVIWWGVIPLIDAIPSAFGSGGMRRF